MWLLRSAHKHIGQDTLNERLDGRLRGRPLQRVERQLEECDACRQELVELQATVSMMRQMPMEAPRRNFVMTAPPPEPARARPILALRAPNWVYAGAASVAALALAVTISVDATGGLSSDPVHRDVAATALATTAESVIVSAPGSGEPSGSSEEESAPPSLAAAAPAAATSDQPVQREPAAGGAAAFGAEATSAPLIADDSATQDQGATLAESAVAPVAAPVPETTGADGDASTATSQTAEALTIEEPSESAAPIPEPAEPELFDGGADGDTSFWWRVLEAASGLLAVAFLAGLVLRWRAGRRNLG